MTWCSRDGQTGLGWASVLSPNGIIQIAFAWHRDSGWSAIPGVYRALAATDDMSVVLATLGEQGVLRFADGSMRLLQPLAGQAGAAGSAMTPSTEVIVGASGALVCRWNAGAPEPLPVLYGTLASGASSVSDDGNTIVGTASYGGSTTSHAMVWRYGGGVFDVRVLLTHAGLDVSQWWLQNAVAVSADGRTVAGNGLHTLESGVQRQEGWVAYLPEGLGCYANCDNSTTPPYLSVADFACFLNLFAAGDTYANCDGMYTPPTLNVNDFICFLNRFAAGCP
jgi:hypothetical protein